MTNFISIVYAADDANISGLYNPARAFATMTTNKDISIAKILKIDNLGSGLDVVNLVFVFTGLYFFFSLISAGWSFMMSSGDPKKAAVAAGQITNAFTGIIMVFTAFLLVRLITNMLGIGNLF